MCGKTKVSRDLAERLHAFEVVVRCAIRLGVFRKPTGRGHTRMFPYHKMALEHFDLTPNQARYCVGRADNFFYDVNRAEKRRNAAKTFSSSVIIRMPEPKTKAA